jgi:hypothetical protein
MTNTLDEEGSDAVGTLLGLSLGINDQHVGVGAVGDPHLISVENKLVTLLGGTELHRNNIRARTRLTHGETTNVLSRDELGKVLLLLLLVTVANNLVDAEIGVSTIGQGNAGTGARNLLHDDAVLVVSKTKTTILF